MRFRKPDWKKRHDIKVPAPRMLRLMKAKPVPMGCKHSRNATSGRNKTEYLKPNTSEAMIRGRQKIMSFIGRGIRLTAK